jgi:sugar phosphate isomerase/epimerase
MSTAGLGWMDRMDLGIIHALAFPEAKASADDLYQSVLEVASDTDFGAIELAPIPDPLTRRRVGELVRIAQLQVVYLPILPVLFEPLAIADQEPGARAAAMTRLRTLIDEAIELRAVFAMVASPRDPGPALRDAAVERLAEDLRTLAQYADARSKDRRLFITLENFDRDVEKRRLIGPTREAAELAERVDQENFGLTIDLSHLPLLQEHPRDALKIAAPHILHAHLGNCVADNPADPLYGDFHPPFGYPGSANDVETVQEFLAGLEAIGYWEAVRRRIGSTPIVSFEVKPAGGESSQAIVANGKRTFLRAWARYRRDERPGSSS